MRFGAKIALVLLAVGVLPVALLGLVSYTVARDELQRTVGRMQVQAANDLALFIERTVTSSTESLALSTAALLPLEGFSRGELTQILQIPYRQLPFVAILALVDDRNAPVAGPAYEARPELEPALAAREPVRDADLAEFSRRLPPPPAARGETAMSAPYRSGRGGLRVAVSQRLARNRSIVAEVVLRDVEDRLAELSRGTGVAYLVDGRGEVLAHGAADSRVTAEERRLPEVGYAKRISWSHLVHRNDGARWLAAFAPVTRYGWGVVIAQPMAVAFGAAERLRFYTVAWSGVGLVLALSLGALLARRVTLPIQRLSRAAGAIAAGDYGAPVDESGRDELAELGRAFVRMTAEIRRRDEEIRAWNEELQKRVADRTAELKTAQDQILRTRKLAAIGSLAAGIAHELNNPMTAITGYLAILRKQAPEDGAQAEMIASAQEQATRMSRVVEDLRSFADQERATSGQRFSLGRTLAAALALYEDRLRASGIALTKRVDEPLPDAQGDPVQIQQVVAHLLENAINAMPRGGKLEVSLGTVDGDALRLRIADTGPGIPPAIRDRIFDPFFTTKERSGQVGLGLSVSHSIVEAHHGRILVDGAEGAGAAVTVLLPAAARAHLA
ncbi:MAG TPA: ATP-binding protein [Anaeromyxobacter sp.]|nr:ATP-binding protein [Anaeromyxobacter sp.]